MMLLIRTDRAILWFDATTATTRMPRAHQEIGRQLSDRAHNGAEAMVDIHQEPGGGGNVPR